MLPRVLLMVCLTFHIISRPLCTALRDRREVVSFSPDEGLFLNLLWSPEAWYLSSPLCCFPGGCSHSFTHTHTFTHAYGHAHTSLWAHMYTQTHTHHTHRVYCSLGQSGEMIVRIGVDGRKDVSVTTD